MLLRKCLSTQLLSSWQAAAPMLSVANLGKRSFHSTCSCGITGPHVHSEVKTESPMMSVPNVGKRHFHSTCSCGIAGPHIHSPVLAPESGKSQGKVERPWSSKEVLAEEERFVKQLHQANSRWVSSKMDTAPKFFENSAKDQKPIALYLGCSDSRVTAEMMLGFEPGELFVHRNIANLVINTDMSMLSVMQFAVEVLEVKHVIVMGHYGCGGVKASMQAHNLGLIDNWLRNIRDVHRNYHQELEALPSNEERFKRLVHLNVAEQVVNVFKTSFVQRKRIETGYPRIHGMVYDIATGKVKNVEVNIQEKLQAFKDVYSLFPLYNDKQ